MSKDRVAFRIEEDLLESIERVADQQDVNRSELLRTWVREGLANSDVADSLDGEVARAQLDSIKRSEYRNKRRAWFRSNVGGRLLKCYNNGLDPEEAETEMRSYRREALELHDDADLAEYVADGLEKYREAYPNASAVLADWVKTGPTADTPAGGVPDGVVDTDPTRQLQSLSSGRGSESVECEECGSPTTAPSGLCGICETQEADQ